MRVLIVQPDMSFFGGAEVVVVNLSMCLTKIGVENSVLTLAVSDEVVKSYKSIDFIAPRKHFDFRWRYSLLNKTLGLGSKVMLLGRMLAGVMDSYDILNVHNFPAHWAVMFKKKKPVVWMCNEPPNLWSKVDTPLIWNIYRKMGIWIDCFIVNRYVDEYCVADEFNMHRAMKRYKRTPHIINYGVDSEPFSYVEEQKVRQRYGLEDSFLLLQVGLLSPQKNQIESIKVIEKLRDEIRNIKLLLVGSTEGEYYQYIKKYIAEKELEQYITFTGHLPKEQVLNIYRTCDLALFPVKVQGGWLSPFEALCASKPIVVSPTMGAASVIQTQKIGLITNDFAEAVRKVYFEPEVYSELARKGKEWVRTNLTWEKYTQKMFEVFKKTLASKRGQE